MADTTLGLTYKDSITSFTGVATGKLSYLTGCNQTMLTPTKQKEDGGLHESVWFDDQRLTLVANKKQITLDNTKTPGPSGRAPVGRSSAPAPKR